MWKWLLRKILFWSGALITTAGVIGLIFVFNDRNRGQNPGNLIGFGILLLVGLFLVFWFRDTIGDSTGEGSDPATSRQGRYLVDQAEPLTGLGFPAEVHFEKEISGRTPRPSSLRVRLPCTLPGEVQCSAETWFDRWSKATGLAVEPQTGDDEFDRSDYLRTDDPGLALQLLADPAHRSAVQLLHALGYQQIDLGPDLVQAIWTGFNPQKDDREQLPVQTARLLEPFTRMSLAPRAEPDLPAVGPGRLAEKLLWGGSLLLALLAVFAWLDQPLRFWQFARLSAGVWGVVVPLAGVLGYGVMRGDSRSHDRWRTWMLPTLLTTALGTCGTLAAFNALADRTPAQTRQLPIQNLREVRGRRTSNGYYAYVPDWDNPRETREFRLSAVEYREARIGRSQLEVTTSEGALGLRWIHHWRFLP